MPTKETKLYSFAFLVKKICFHLDACTLPGKITAKIKFLRYCEQTIFEPTIPPTSNELHLNAGKSFTFGLNREMALNLAKQFIIDVYLQQIEPEKCLSKVQVDVTKKFCEVFKSSCPSKSKTQVKTTIQFNDNEDTHIADMDIIMRLSPSGPTIMREFNLDADVDNHYIAVKNDCKCPKVPDLKVPCKKPDNDDEGEWDIMCAELENGQKIAIKYKRSYYEFNPTGYDKPCNNDEDMSESEEKLNVHMISLMDEMHKIIAAKATTN